MSRGRIIVLTLFCMLVLPVLVVAMVCHAIIGSRKRALRMAIGIDQTGNAALGGSEDETISSRCGRAKRDGKWWGGYAVTFVDALFWDGHCEEAIGT